MSQQARRDARGTGLNVLGIVVQALLPAFHVQLARFLGASGYGLYTWSATFVDALSVVTLFGCDQAVVRQVSVLGPVDRSAAAAVVGSALRIVACSGLVVFVGMYFGAPVIAAVQGKPGLVGPLRCLVLVPLFYHVATVLLAATQSLGVMKWAFWARSIAQPLVLLGTTSVALRIGMGPSGAAVAVVIGMAATAVLACAFYARELPLGATLRAAIVGPIHPAMLRVALPLVAASLLWALVGRVDAFFLGHYGTGSELGAYAACALYAASISQVRGAFEPVTGALVAPALARHDAAGLSDAITRQTRWLALVVFAIAGVLIGFGEPILRVFGHEFTEGAPALAVLAAAHAVNAIALASFVLPLSGNARYTTWVAACTLVVQAGLGVVLVPRFGLVGAALVLFMGLAGAQAAQLVITARVVGVRGLSRGVVVASLCAAAGLGAGRIAYHATDASMVVRFGIGVLTFATAYTVLAWTFAFTREDRGLLFRALGGAMRRVRVS